jgi:hypothetical protein
MLDTFETRRPSKQRETCWSSSVPFSILYHPEFRCSVIKGHISAYISLKRKHGS